MGLLGFESSRGEQPACILSSAADSERHYRLVIDFIIDFFDFITNYSLSDSKFGG